MLEQVEKKNSKSSPRALLLGAAVLVVAGIVYLFWPNVKGFRQTAKAALASNADVSLTAILYAEDNPLAMVDGKIVREGDMIGGVKVVKILKNGVEFETSDTRWTQYMPGGEEGVSSGVPVLLQLGSHKCPPCRRMMPILDKLRADYSGKFQIRYIDVEKKPAAASRYGVRAIPTQIFLDRTGKEAFRHVGFYSRQDILDTWSKLGVEF
ncbi:MAG: thioredoxin domain-containing protein [Planctomycetota bacterium]|jgi:thioredoxin 1